MSSQQVDCILLLSWYHGVYGRTLQYIVHKALSPFEYTSNPHIYISVVSACELNIQALLLDLNAVTGLGIYPLICTALFTNVWVNFEII